MPQTLYIVTSTEKAGDQILETFVQGVYSTLELAQQKLQAAVVEDIECYPERAPFEQKEDSDDICIVDKDGGEYHYNIIQRSLDL